MNFTTDLLDEYCFENYGHKNWKQEFDDNGREVIIFEPVKVFKQHNKEAV